MTTEELEAEVARLKDENSILEIRVARLQSVERRADEWKIQFNTENARADNATRRAEAAEKELEVAHAMLEKLAQE